MAIKGPKSEQSIGFVSSQFRDLLAIHQANMDREIQESKEKSAEFWAKMTLGVGALKELKNYRDAYLADKRLDKVHFQGIENPMSMYQKGQSKERKLGKGKILGNIKDFIWTPDLEANEELKQFFHQKKKVKDEETGNMVTRDVLSQKQKTNLIKQLRGKGMSNEDVQNVLGLNDPLEEIDSKIAWDKEQKELSDKKLADIELQDKKDKIISERDSYFKEQLGEIKEDEEWMAKAEAGKAKQDAYKAKVMREGDAAKKELDKLEFRPFERDQISTELMPLKSNIRRMTDKEEGKFIERKSKERLKELKSINIEDYQKQGKRLPENLSPSQLDAEIILARKDIKFGQSLKKGKGIAYKKDDNYIGSGMSKKDYKSLVKDRQKKYIEDVMQDKRQQLRNDAALMNIQSMEKGGKVKKGSVEDLNIVIKELEKASKMHLGQSKRIDKHLKSMQNGGMLKGPSHKDGGILTQVGDQPIEMEGGEYVIKKSSAKKLGKKTLDKINSTGKLPKMAKGGGLYANIHAKRKRIEKGSGEKMRKPGSKGAPTNANFKRAAKTAKMENGGSIEYEINDPNFLDDALGTWGNIESMRNPEGGLKSVAPALSIGETGTRYAEMGAQKLGFEKTSKALGDTSQVLGGASNVLGGLQAFDSQDETGISQAQGALSVTKGVSDIAGVTLGKKVGEKALSKAAPVLSVASGAKDILSADSTAIDKASGAASVASGVAGAASTGLLGTTAATAATNFWNPVGWVAGAAAIGLSAASLMGMGKKAGSAKYRAAKINI